MVYEFLGINWAMDDLVRDELWAWKDISNGRKHVNLIPRTKLWVLWKKRNEKAFEEKEADLFRVRDL